MKTINLPFRIKKPALACGADLKGAFALAKGDRAYLIDGFGDLGDAEGLERYEKAIKAYSKKLKISPKTIICDMHPGYLSTGFAESLQKRSGLKLHKVQHHEAHVASAMVDNSIKGDVIGFAFDGTGYGTDGKIWGGEVFVGDLKKLRRIAHLEYAVMPGGETAIKEPWRMAISYLYKAFGEDFHKPRIELLKNINMKRLAVAKEMIDKGFNSPLTSSMGRLFDAVGSIVLAREKACFEAELPIVLEKMAKDTDDRSYPFQIKENGIGFEVDVSKTIRGIVRDMLKGIDEQAVSSRFHNAIAGMILAMSEKLSKKFKARRVVLTGGVFQNKYLLNKSIRLLEKRGFKVYTHSNVSTNDSGIPIGQIAIANARF